MAGLVGGGQWARKSNPIAKSLTRVGGKEGEGRENQAKSTKSRSLCTATNYEYVPSRIIALSVLESNSLLHTGLPLFPAFCLCDPKRPPSLTLGLQRESCPNCEEWNGFFVCGEPGNAARSPAAGFIWSLSCFRVLVHYQHNTNFYCYLLSSRPCSCDPVASCCCCWNNIYRTTTAAATTTLPSISSFLLYFCGGRFCPLTEPEKERGARRGRRCRVVGDPITEYKVLSWSTHAPQQGEGENRRQCIFISWCARMCDCVCVSRWRPKAR